MKVLLVCAGGCSTGFLLKRLAAYADEHGIELEIKAVGLGGYQRICHEYECILVGPQVGYFKDDIVKATGGMPVEVMAPEDYGIGNCEHLLQQMIRLTGCDERGRHTA